MKRILLACLITAVATVAAAQNNKENLVYNGSFEEHVGCPERVDALGIMRGVDAWWQPTAGSSDYFNACAGKECGVPRNKMGNQTAHSGDAYCGIYCSQVAYREYLQTELREPLKEGCKYRVTFFVSLADKSPHAVATIGAMLTPDMIADATSDILMQREIIEIGDGQTASIATNFEPQVINPLERVLSDTKGWTEVTGVFTAKGGEHYLTIGNFADFNHSAVNDMFNPVAVLQGAYYYIDDVSVTCLECPEKKADTITVADSAAPHIAQFTPSMPPKAGDIVTLRDVYFDVDSYELMPQSYNELSVLIAILKTNPDMKIELRGHTDNSGTQAHNIRLSENRAKAVMEYLISRGIDSRRLTARGYGEKKPVASNDTPEGRTLNRRVEYRVLK